MTCLEFEAVDYTKQEDVKDFVNHRNRAWGLPVTHQDRGYFPPPDFTAPDEALKMVDQADKLAAGPVLRRLEGASDDLYASAFSGHG